MSAALRDARLAEAIHLPAGRTLTLESNTGTLHALAIELTLLGQFRLSGKSGASVAFDERPDVLAFFDRQGPGDRCLDAWLLAVGLTPLSASARSWADAPSIDLAPLPLGTRTAALVMRPFGATFDSRYQRDWDAARLIWRQVGIHRLKLLPGLTIEVASEAIIEPAVGVREVSVSCRGHTHRFTLRETGTVGDVGVAPTFQSLPAPAQD